MKNTPQINLTMVANRFSFVFDLKLLLALINGGQLRGDRKLGEEVGECQQRSLAQN